MNAPDVIIRPGNFILGLWWSEWPRVTAHEGGQWIAWAIRDYEGDGRTVWHFWMAWRRDVDSPWERMMSVVENTAQGAVDHGNHLFQNTRREKVFVQGNCLLVNGRGSGFLRAFEANPQALPPWLHVLVIEHREQGGVPAWAISL